MVWRRPAKAGPQTPLVVFLHGRGADENDLIDIAGRLPRSFTYASVRAPVAVEGGGFTWFENRGPGRRIPGKMQTTLDGFRSWLDDPGIGCSTRPCYLFGFSAGMMMAGALLLGDPGRFAGAVLLSGVLALDGPAGASPGQLAEVPIFYGRGSFDDVIPAPLVVQTDAYLRERSGAAITFRDYPIGHSISERELSDIAAWIAERG